jgi:hypothetical protein
MALKAIKGSHFAWAVLKFGRQADAGAPQTAADPRTPFVKPQKSSFNFSDCT